MNKKILAIVIAIMVIVIAGLGISYLNYQDEVLSEKFNENLKNASSIEDEITSTTEQFNTQESTDVDVLINTINNDITPKYSEEIALLNKTLEYTNNNVTKEQYLANQTKRIELESKNLNATVTTLYSISQYVKGEKSAEDAQNSINKANEEMENSIKELNDVYDNISKLLEENPELNQTLHDLDLKEPFYGEEISINQTQSLANATTTP